MAFRARLAAPQPEPRQDWPWHQTKWASLASHLLWGGQRRMEAENYLSSGFGLRIAIQSRAAGWQRLGDLAKIWAPPRIKTILVSPEYGAPYLNTSQAFSIRPTARKWLSVDKTVKAETRFVKQGTILVLASASVGRSAITTAAHEGAVISHHFMRVELHDSSRRGWVYGFLKSPQVRAMTSSAQYASVIRHIEPSHLGAIPVPIVRDEIAADFESQTQDILDLRNRADKLSLAAEERFASVVGPVQKTARETGFVVQASRLIGGRRRMEAGYYAPTAAAILDRFKTIKAAVSPLATVAENVWWMARFKRFYGEEGIPYRSADELFTTNADETKRVLVENGDDHERYFVKRGWIVMACSGQTYGLNGAARLVSEHEENVFFSHDLIRIIPRSSEIRAGYLVTALTHPILGRPLLIRAAYGTSIPHLDPHDVSAFPVVRVAVEEEAAIADFAEEAAALRALAEVKERALAAAAGELIDQFVAGDMLPFVITMPSAIVGHPPSPDARTLPEHTRVRLRRALPSSDLSAGAVGTIVHVYKTGSGYEVEFSEGLKRPAVETLSAADVEELIDEDV